MVGTINEPINLELSENDVLLLTSLKMADTYWPKYSENGAPTFPVAAFTSLVNLALAGHKCPYGSPPADIVVDYDSARNMYLRCLHDEQHCWEYSSGRSIGCP